MIYDEMGGEVRETLSEVLPRPRHSRLRHAARTVAVRRQRLDAARAGDDLRLHGNARIKPTAARYAKKKKGSYPSSFFICVHIVKYVRESSANISIVKPQHACKFSIENLAIFIAYFSIEILRFRNESVRIPGF